MTQNDYLVLLLEESHLARTLTGLQYEEQKCLAQIQRVKHDLHANSKLPKIREDMAAIKGVLNVHTNLINSQIEKTYDIKFKSFKVDYYEDILGKKEEQVSEQKDGV